MRIVFNECMGPTEFESRCAALEVIEPFLSNHFGLLKVVPPLIRWEFLSLLGKRPAGQSYQNVFQNVSRNVRKFFPHARILQDIL